jgi:hypothetical protein
LSQVILAEVLRIGGWFGVALLRTALSAATLGLTFAALRERSALSARAFWFTLMSACLLLPTLQMRPQLFGLVCFAMVVWLLSSRHRVPVRVWAIVPIMCFWANVHGTFVLAVGLIGLAWLEDLRARAPRTHQLIPLGFAAIGATFVNPFGIAVWQYVFALTGNENVRRLATEWQRPSMDSYSGAIFLLSVPLVAWRVARAWRSQSHGAVAWPTLVTLGSFLFIGATSVRGVYWWAIIAPVVVAGLPVASKSATRSTSRAIAVPSWALTALCGVLMVVPLGRWFTRDSGVSVTSTGSASLPMPPVMLMENAPAGITDALRHAVRPGDRVFNAQMWGSWFEYALPDNPVVIDSRIELFADSVWSRYADIANGRSGWQEALMSWQVRAVAISAAQQPKLLPNIRADSAWQQVYEDSDGAVFVRR